MTLQGYASVVPVSDVAPRVLLVDDVHERRELVVATMLREGYDVKSLPSADGFVDVVETFDADLIILAMNEGVDGMALCGELRARAVGGHTPVILLGEEASEDAVSRALLGGADDHMTTPVRLVELAARVRVQLRTKRMLDALTRIRAERDSFRREAVSDPLTGLPNRRALEDAVAKAIEGGDTFSILFVDIDHFKRINDTFGHGVGDEVLRAVADRLNQGMRQQDVCARVGGEEFVVLLTRAGAMVATAVAERHRIRVASMRFSGAGYPEKVTASVGVAIYDPFNPDKDVDAIFKRADDALYEAKGKGRNCVVVAGAPERVKERVPESVKSSRSPTIRVSSTQPPPPESTPPLSDWSSSIERELKRRLESRRTALPILPDVAQSALRLASDPNANVLELVRLVEKSPPIAARFLALANSAIYSRGLKVTSIQIAVVRMGLLGARDVLIQMSYEAQAAGLRRYRDAVGTSFERSVVAAHVCRAASPKLGLSSEFDYLAGLLHDIGEAHVYRVLDGMPDRPSDALVTTLVRRYHTTAGAEIARAWQLPDPIARVCANHHDESPDGPLVRLVMLSDIVVAASESTEVSLDPEVLARLDVDEPFVLSLLESARVATTLARGDFSATTL